MLLSVVTVCCLPTAHGGQSCSEKPRRVTLALIYHPQYQDSADTRWTDQDDRSAFCTQKNLFLSREERSSVYIIRVSRFWEGSLNEFKSILVSFEISCVFGSSLFLLSSQAHVMTIRHRGHLSATVMILTDHQSVGITRTSFDDICYIRIFYCLNLRSPYSIKRTLNDTISRYVRIF